MKSELAINRASFEERWDIHGVLDFIRRRNSKAVAVQFPDELLHSAVDVVQALQVGCRVAGLAVEVYLLADTTYNSLGVDEVAAAHITADAMVHYGRASFTPLSRLPTYFVLGRADLDVQRCAKAIADYAIAPLNPDGMKMLLVILDQPLLWALANLQEGVARAMEESGKKGLGVKFAEVGSREREPERPCCQSIDAEDSRTPCEAPDSLNSKNSDAHELGGYCWNLPPDISPKECIWLWVGEANTQALQQLQLTYHDHEWAMLEPHEERWQDGVPLEVTKSLRQRYYLVEKAKNANIIGILVGTLGAAGYRDAIESVRKLAQAAGKKTYTFLMGKPSPAKLANFPEVEIFVHIADPQGHILDSKEYYAPIITPHEALLAFTPGAEWGGKYHLDFEGLLRDTAFPNLHDSHAAPRFSLVDSQNYNQQTDQADGAEHALSVPSPQELLSVEEGGKHLIQVQSAAGFLKLRRSFQGLESPAVGYASNEPSKVRKGRSGRAAGYQEEAKP